MSIFGKKAAEVRKQGALNRGEFQPTGKPKDVYLFWLRHQKYPPTMENFCHFWRVVAVWAPLLWLRLQFKALGGFLASKAATSGGVIAGLLVVIGVLITLAITVDAAFVYVPLTIIALVYATLGVVAGFIANSEYDSLAEMRADEDETETAMVNLWTLPISWPAYHVARFLHAVPQKVWDVLLLGIAGVAGIALVGLIGTLLFLGAGEFGWMLLVAIVAVVAGIAGLFGLLYLFFIARDAFLQRRDRKEAEYEAKVASGEIKPKEPVQNVQWVPGPFLSKIIGFLVGVKDFAVLAFNVVRVNKWKICPIVKIEQ